MNTTVGPKNGQNPLSHQKEVVYPDNLNPRDLLYFMFAPTLTYQLNYPRLKRRRQRLLVKWCLMLVVTGLSMGFMQVKKLLQHCLAQKGNLHGLQVICPVHLLHCK